MLFSVLSVTQYQVINWNAPTSHICGPVGGEEQVVDADGHTEPRRGGVTLARVSWRYILHIDISSIIFFRIIYKYE